MSAPAINPGETWRRHALTDDGWDVIDILGVEGDGRIVVKPAAVHASPVDADPAELREQYEKVADAPDATRPWWL